MDSLDKIAGLTAADRKFLIDVAQEMVRSRELFPSEETRTHALHEEHGETTIAYMDEPWANVEKEAVQCASTALRLAIEGPGTVIRELRASKGLDNHTRLVSSEVTDLLGLTASITEMIESQMRTQLIGSVRHFESRLTFPAEFSFCVGETPLSQITDLDGLLDQTLVIHFKLITVRYGDDLRAAMQRKNHDDAPIAQLPLQTLRYLQMGRRFNTAESGQAAIGIFWRLYQELTYRQPADFHRAAHA